MTEIWNEVYLNNWKEYTQFLMEKNLLSRSWIFRGQSESTWNITTSFDRIFAKAVKTRYNDKRRTFGNSHHLQREEKIISLFRSKSHLYTTLNPRQLLTLSDTENFKKNLVKQYKEEDLYEVFIKFEWLAIMQHYSAPTRLIDWTFSPYIGALFALEDFSENACVYALDKSILENYNIELQKTDNFYFDFFHELDERNDGSFIIYSPSIKTQRISQQQGLFLVPTTVKKPASDIFENIVKNIHKPIGYIMKFKKEAILDSINQLELMGITSETLYPGIDGLSKTLRLELFR